jgi:hypothetical protein
MRDGAYANAKLSAAVDSVIGIIEPMLPEAGTGGGRSVTVAPVKAMFAVEGGATSRGAAVVGGGVAVVKGGPGTEKRVNGECFGLSRRGACSDFFAKTGRFDVAKSRNKP